MLHILTPNIKYIVADFRSIEGTSYWYIIVFGNFEYNVMLFKSTSVLYPTQRLKVPRYSKTGKTWIYWHFGALQRIIC